jgi:ssDNA-binding Zn-finger/Zn-ribbon topoisomerase 1
MANESNNQPLEYTCDKCGEAFVSGWSDEEASAEFEENFPETADEEETAVLCDDCYKAFMQWLETQDREALRNGDQAKTN